MIVVPLGTRVGVFDGNIFIESGATHLPVCCHNGNRLRPTMRAASAASAVETDAVGARMLNCETGTPFITMAVDRQSAMNHAAGTLSSVEFRELWEPQR